jgi:hypothetical protein
MSAVTGHNGTDGAAAFSSSSSSSSTSPPSTSAVSVTVRVAGGWVRDKILGLPSHDVDVAVDSLTGVQFATLVQQYVLEVLLPQQQQQQEEEQEQQHKHQLNNLANAASTTTVAAGGSWKKDDSNGNLLSASRRIGVVRCKLEVPADLSSISLRRVMNSRSRSSAPKSNGPALSSVPLCVASRARR